MSTGAIRSTRRAPRGQTTKRPASNAALAKVIPVVPSTPPPATVASSRAPSPTHSGVRFSDFSSRVSKQLLDHVPFEFCTHVQAETMGPILDGHDVLARAKTGTGKTIAFMLPAIERMLKERALPDGRDVSILVLSPTRELAQQIAVEASSLAQSASLGVQCVVGGTNMKAEAARFKKQKIDVLVATPGRLIDHLENSHLGNHFRAVKCLILDEADRLLDSGFKPALQKILAALPDRNQIPRQTLLFSATLPAGVKSLSATALLPNYKYISTVSETEQSTHEHVKQEVAIVNSSDIFAAASSLICDAIAADPPSAKLIVFLPTARETGLFAELFTNILSQRGERTPVFEVHSRKSQSARTKATDGFRKATSGVLFSSDVTARGIDIPGVTVVFQIGLPSDPEQYIHRLGRTARAGNEGRGILILSTEESFFLKKRAIAALPLVPCETPQVVSGSELAKYRQATGAALAQIDDATKAQTYQAWLGFRKGFMRDLGWNEQGLVQAANQYALRDLQFKGEGEHAGQPPPLFASTVGKMGLRAVRAQLNVIPDAQRVRNNGR